MEEPPRGKDQSLFSRGGMACTLFYGFLIAVISLTAFLRLPVGILAAEGKRITAESLSLVLGDPAVLARSQTYAFTVLGLSQLFHAVGMRDVGRSVFRMNHLENRLMLAAAALGVLLQVLVTENSRLVALFQTAALSGTEWRELLFLAAAPLAAHELLAGLSRISGARGTAEKKGRSRIIRASGSPEGSGSALRSWTDPENAGIPGAGGCFPGPVRFSCPVRLPGGRR